MFHTLTIKINWIKWLNWSDEYQNRYGRKINHPKDRAICLEIDLKNSENKWNQKENIRKNGEWEGKGEGERLKDASRICNTLFKINPRKGELRGWQNQ